MPDLKSSIEELKEEAGHEHIFFYYEDEVDYKLSLIDRTVQIVLDAAKKELDECLGHHMCHDQAINAIMSLDKYEN
jgi:hypothetical protein